MDYCVIYQQRIKMAICFTEEDTPLKRLGAVLSKRLLWLTDDPNNREVLLQEFLGCTMFTSKGDFEEFEELYLTPNGLC